jgi:hypothetical protein
MANCDIQIGRGTKIRIAPMGGTCVEPFEISITTAAATVRSVTPTTVAVPALPANTFIPAGAWIKAVNLNGTESLLQLTADAVAGATTLAVTNVPVGIASGAVINYPPILGSRTAANFTDQGNEVEIYTFDSGGYSEGKVATRKASMELPGRYDQLNPGFLNARDAATNVGSYAFLWVEYLAPSSNYSKGQIRKGIGSFSTYSEKVDVQQITMSDLTFTFNGAPTVIAPVLAV